ncbi:calcium-transporting ATPase 13, plasma membrane-type [Dorcoceras hygrometricum]|uniref:Calcium-transporting ATPase 13, plasma membrane-type n=1 Tax=Dorcoceras hygrometricum TaxID=472368 RepID=A0A2Z6ZS41_9LAMI|nr:calcium-transporting ATPase 13, plasma membrane-type [Dorcoceras hygrometricum]
MEITKIMMGKSIKIPGVTKLTWFLKSLPRIPAADKGKEVLVEKDPVKGNPAEEHYSLICADIDFLVDLRAKVIDQRVEMAQRRIVHTVLDADANRALFARQDAAERDRERRRREARALKRRRRD